MPESSLPRKLYSPLNLFLSSLKFANPTEWSKQGVGAGHVPGSLWRCILIGALALSPVVDGHPDRVWSKIAAEHLVFGNAAQRVGYALLGYLVGLLDVFAQNHFCRHRSAGNSHRAAHAFEFHLLNDVILDL